MTCGGNDVCIPREKFIGGFKSRGEALPDIKWEIKEILVAGDRVIVRGEASGTPSGVFRGIPASGKSFKIMSIDIHTIEDGKIKRSYHVEDWAGAMRLGNPHPLSGKMPSMPFPGSWQVKNGRLFLATTEVPPSSDWCNKQEIQAVAATIQRLFRRQQNRIRF